MKSSGIAVLGFCVFEEGTDGYYTKNQVAKYADDLSKSFEHVWLVGNLVPRRGSFSTRMNSVSVTPVPFIKFSENLLFSAIVGTIRTLRTASSASTAILNIPAPGYIPLIIPAALFYDHFAVYIAQDPHNSIDDDSSSFIEHLNATLKQILVVSHTILALRLADTIIVRGDPEPYERYGEVFVSKPIVQLEEIEIERSDEMSTLLYVGGLYERKGVDVLLKSVRRIRDNGYDVNLLVVGEGDEHQNLSSLSESLGISDSVEFVGYVDDPEELAEIYASADLLVHPAKYGEGFPRVLDEANHYGVPVIATELDHYRERLRDGENVLFADPDSVSSLVQSIEVAIEDADLRMKLMQGGKKRVENLEEETAGEQHARILMERS